MKKKTSVISKQEANEPHRSPEKVQINKLTCADYDFTIMLIF